MQWLVCVLSYFWGFSPSIPSVMQRQRWVMQKHPGTRVTHDFFDFFFHVGAVAVDEAFAAGAFFVLKGAFVKAHKRVFLELPAFGAEFAVGAVVSFAVDFHHVVYGFLFTFHSFVFWVGRLRLHVSQLK